VLPSPPPSNRYAEGNHNRNPRGIARQQHESRLSSGGINRAPQQLIEEAGFVICAREQARFPLHLWQLGTQLAGEALLA
jgi:hypothetical protein